MPFFIPAGLLLAVLTPTAGQYADAALRRPLKAGQGTAGPAYRCASSHPALQPGCRIATESEQSMGHNRMPDQPQLRRQLATCTT